MPLLACIGQERHFQLKLPENLPKNERMLWGMSSFFLFHQNFFTP